MAYTKFETRITYYLGSGTLTPNTYDYRGFISTYYDQTDDDKSNNRSRVKIEVGANANKSLLHGYTLTAKVNGTTKINKSFSKTVGTGYTVDATSTDILIPHTDAGTGSVTIQLTIKDESGDTQSLTYTYNLPDISVKSTITNNTSDTSRINFGSPVTFSITRPSSNPTHKLTYKVGDTTYTIGSGITTSKEYTFPTSLINSFPNTDKPNITVTCTSSNGTTSNTVVYLNVPSSYKPTCSLSLSEGSSVIPSGWNVYVRRKSKISGVVSASGSAGSTINSYKTTGNGQTFTSNTFTSSELSSSGNLTFSTTVTDTRGRTATASQTINVIDYWTPTISSYSVTRCDANGLTQEDGTYGKIKCKYSIAPVNNGSTNLNNKSLKVKYGSVTKTFALTSYSGTIEPTELFEGLETNANHTFEFYIIDSFNPNGIKFTFVMPPAYTTISKLAGGKGITFGQIATEEGFHSYMDATFHGAFSAPNAKFVNQILPIITDCNDTSILTGFYHCNSNTTNTPYSASWYLMHIRTGTQYKKQIIYRVSSNEIFIRYLSGSDTWSEWERLNEEKAFGMPYKGSSGSGWWKIATITTSNSSLAIYKIEGYSNANNLPGRGSFELMVGTGNNNSILNVVFGTKGIDKSKFDYRDVGGGVYEVWFYIPQYTRYQINIYLKKLYSGNSSIVVNNEAGTPSGTQLTIE